MTQPVPERRATSGTTVQIGSRTFGAGQPAVAVPVMGGDVEQALAAAAQVPGQPVDLVEWRIDHLAPEVLDDLQRSGALADVITRLADAVSPAPLLVTYRTRGQGGLGDAPPHEVLTLIEQLVALAGVDAVDVEFDHPHRDACLAAARAAGCASVVSHHDWDGQSAREALGTLVAGLRGTGADAVKLATTPPDTAAALDLLAALEAASREGGAPVAMLGMGDAGRLTRLVGPACGSWLTFAHLGAASAPGQLAVGLVATTVEALRER